MRPGTEAALARVVGIFGAAQRHQAYLFAKRMKVLAHDNRGSRSRVACVCLFRILSIVASTRRWQVKINGTRCFKQVMPALTLGLPLLAMMGDVVAQQHEAKRGSVPVASSANASAELVETAMKAGYTAGLSAGRTDRSRGDRFDFKNEIDYKAASKGFSASLGAKKLYQRHFRTGFEQGYKEGWNG
jgi:hypothetical protein